MVPACPQRGQRSRIRGARGRSCVRGRRRLSLRWQGRASATPLRGGRAATERKGRQQWEQCLPSTPPTRGQIQNKEGASDSAAGTAGFTGAQGLTFRRLPGEDTLAASEQMKRCKQTRAPPRGRCTPGTPRVKIQQNTGGRVESETRQPGRETGRQVPQNQTRTPTWPSTPLPGTSPEDGKRRPQGAPVPHVHSSIIYNK